MAKKKKSGKQLKVANRVKAAAARIEDVTDGIMWLKMCVYAKNGKGKTKFGASYGPGTLVIDCNERGTPSIRKQKGVKRFQVNTWTDIDLIYWYLKSGKHKFKVVSIDTLTSLNVLCLKFVLKDESEKDISKDPNMPSQRDYGKGGKLMRDMILKFRSLDMHVIFLAQEKASYIEDDDDESVSEVFPNLPNSSRSTLTDHVNIIGRMFTKPKVIKKKVKGKVKKKIEKQHYILLGDHPHAVTKVNIEDHNLPRVMHNPTLPKIIKLIQEG